jgi:spermidine/putrescine transport system permease protein
VSGGRGSGAADRRWGAIERAGSRGLNLYTVLVYLFLFAPIVVVVIFSFNGGRHASELQGFSVQWNERAWTNPFVTKALRNSLVVAATTATLATIAGTLAALAMPSLPRRLRGFYEQLTYVAIIVPGIVIGIATLIFLVTAFSWVNPWFEYLGGPAAPRLGLGLHSIVAAHTLFTMAIVSVIVSTRMRGMDRTLIEASADLYATPLRTFLEVTLPQLLPAILAGGLLAFTFSFDDFIIAFFTTGQDQTLPIYLFSSIRRGVTPEVNAIASVLLAITVSAMLFSGLLLRGRRRAQRRRVAAEPGTAHVPAARGEAGRAEVPAG